METPTDAISLHKSDMPPGRSLTVAMNLLKKGRDSFFLFVLIFVISDTILLQ